MDRSSDGSGHGLRSKEVVEQKRQNWAGEHRGVGNGWWTWAGMRSRGEALMWAAIDAPPAVSTRTGWPSWREAG